MAFFTTSDGTRLRYETAGDKTNKALILSNSLGTRLEMWDPQMADFTQHFFVIRYDKRGHGESEVKTGPTTFERLTRDAFDLLDHLHVRKAHWCGLSMGGASGQMACLMEPRRIERAVFANTAAFFNAVPGGWDARIGAIRSGGMASIVPPVIDRWFTKGFQQSDKAAVARVVRMLQSTPDEGYIACCHALRDLDLRERISGIKQPVLVISGTHDGSTPPAMGQFIAGEVPHARYVEFDAAHLSNIEQSDGFTQSVLAHLLD